MIPLDIIFAISFVISFHVIYATMTDKNINDEFRMMLHDDLVFTYGLSVLFMSPLFYLVWRCL